MPFEILRDGDGRYLVQDRAFIYLTEPSLLVELAGALPTRATGRLVVMGGVDYGGGGDGGRWWPLVGTVFEAAAVARRHAQTFPLAERVTLTAGDATETRLRALMPTSSILHLATHGDFEQGSTSTPFEIPTPTLSRIVCAGANTTPDTGAADGYLTAEEVAWMDLSACDLVVLSGCDTGLGRAESGDGLLGLRRAFHMAGARTVVSSLWSIPDQETAELMDRFYTNLWERGLGKHAALRAAQLEMIERDVSPEHWGAFVLDGDWR